MRKMLIGAVAVLGALSMAAPASAAATLLDLDCDLTTGCLFSGNDNDPAAVEATYNLLHEEPPAPDTLVLDSFLFKLESSEDYPAEGDFADGLSSYDWTSPYGVTFVVVKAANNFMLYKLAAPAFAGTALNTGLFTPNGNNLAAISHISFYGDDSIVPPTGIVPEPATWAMMLMGFFGIGSALRSSRRRPAALA